MTPVVLSAWWLLPLVFPVLWAGAVLRRHCPPLARFNIPVPVIGGLAFCLLMLALNLSGLVRFSVGTRVSAGWWTWLINRHRIKTSRVRDVGEVDEPDSDEHSIGAYVRGLAALGRRLVPLLLILAVTLKVGAWVGYGLQQAGLLFPAYMGAMLTGVVVRNVHDALGLRWFDSASVDLLGSFLLIVFLAIAMSSLNLIDLASTAGPMLVILTVQVGCMALFAAFITFRLMGRDYDAAMMAAGHCGFGLGATSNAVANMHCLVARYGASPKAFLIVPTAGGLLVDFTNALNITLFLNWLR